ncbi:MAG: hypothetical protein WCC66_15090 [Rhizobiaceae bacterium]
MKRIFSILILGHWFLFFVLHAFGALAGTLTFAKLAAMPLSVAGFEATGPMRAMPLISAGMGLAALLAATLFMWAFLAALVSGNEVDAAQDVEKFAFGSAATVFSMLSAVSIVNADSAMLLASTVYLAALILSWSATRVEAPVAISDELDEHISIQVARSMAGDAAYQNQLGRISGREQG